jgi:hypothetical protein
VDPTPLYVVVQTRPEPPTPQQLWAARELFRMRGGGRIPILPKRVCGILLSPLPFAQAAQAQELLKEAGIDTDLADRRELPVLSPAVKLRRVDCLPAGLAIYDALGRQRIIDWPKVMLVAAGNVSLTEVVRQRVDNSNNVSPLGTAAVLATGMIGFGVGLVGGGPQPQPDTTHEERTAAHAVLEFILDDTLRYEVLGELFNYAYLAGRLQPTAVQNYALLARDMIQLAAKAELNLGAEALRQNRPPVEYRSRKLFEDEIIWRMWKRAQGEGSAGQ